MAEHDQTFDAGARLVRLLAMLAFLARAKEASIAELASRFSMNEAEIVEELELAACCGLPPYTPDQLLELVIDDDRVYAYGLDALRSPPRLTPDEGFAVAAAARVLLSVPGAEAEGPLAGALAKLELALGETRVQVEIDLPEHLGVLRQAAASNEVVEIDYLGAHRGEETRRRVEPYFVVAREGRFYLDAYCQLAGDWRRFALDRIAAVRETGERSTPRTPPPVLSGARAFLGGPGTTLVEVVVPEASRVLLERFAAGPARREDDGTVVVPVEVADEEFLGRLLLRLGEGAAVRAPGDGLGRARAKTAERALERYRSGPGAT